jgi:hypothetical protein
MVTGEGTGGLMVVLANQIVGGVYNSQGSAGMYPDPNKYNNNGSKDILCGGSSGGGCIVLITKYGSTVTSHNTNGGPRVGKNYSSGGAGGTGAYASYIVENLFN